MATSQRLIHMAQYQAELFPKIMQKTICLLTPREGILLSSGLLPEGSCRKHRHIDLSQALVLTGGAENYPRHDYENSLTIAKDAGGNRCAWAEWAELPVEPGAEQIIDIEGRLRADGFDELGIQHELQRMGRLSMKHVVLRMAKEWTASQSWLPIGTEGRIKHGKTHCPRAVSYSLTQCRDNNQVQAGF